MQGNVLWILLSQDVLHKFMSQGTKTSTVHHLEVTEDKKTKKKGLGVFQVYSACDPDICH